MLIDSPSGKVPSLDPNGKAEHFDRNIAQMNPPNGRGFEDTSLQSETPLSEKLRQS